MSDHTMWRIGAASFFSIALAACGGGGGDGSPNSQGQGSSSTSSVSSSNGSNSSTSNSSSSTSSTSSSGGSQSSSSSSVAGNCTAPAASRNYTVPAGYVDAKSLTDTTAALYWSGFAKMGVRSYLPASDPINTDNHVATATPAPGTPTVYPTISSDPTGGCLTVEREVAPLNGWHSYYRGDNTVGNHKQVLVTGGASAADNRVYTCGTKQCIFDAIREAKNEPKIIRVYGNIDMRVETDGFKDFTSWDDQKASSILLPSNTTLIGINAPDGSPARLISAQIEIGKEFASTVEQQPRRL
ncbi:MAG: hypothetical protein QM803_21130 [Rhodocyclaceae bacterium]